MIPTLVIGIGNDLRRDDGVGIVVARRIEAMELADVSVRTAPQLLPEMVEWFVGVDRVVIVDASLQRDEVEVRLVRPDDDSAVMSHHLDPAGLSAMAARIGVPVPDCLLVSIPASDVGIGEGTSPSAARACDVAVRLVLGLVRPDGGRWANYSRPACRSWRPTNTSCSSSGSSSS